MFVVNCGGSIDMGWGSAKVFAANPPMGSGGLWMVEMRVLSEPVLTQLLSTLIQS